MSLVNLLSGVVVLNTLGLTLDDWLNLFNDMLVDMFTNDRCVD